MANNELKRLVKDARGLIDEAKYEELITLTDPLFLPPNTTFSNNQSWDYDNCVGLLHFEHQLSTDIPKEVSQLAYNIFLFRGLSYFNIAKKSKENAFPVYSKNVSREPNVSNTNWSNALKNYELAVSINSNSPPAFQGLSELYTMLIQHNSLPQYNTIPPSNQKTRIGVSLTIETSATYLSSIVNSSTFESPTTNCVLNSIQSSRHIELNSKLGSVLCKLLSITSAALTKEHPDTIPSEKASKLVSLTLRAALAYEEAQQIDRALQILTSLFKFPSDQSLSTIQSFFISHEQISKFQLSSQEKSPEFLLTQIILESYFRFIRVLEKSVRNHINSALKQTIPILEPAFYNENINSFNSNDAPVTNTQTSSSFKYSVNLPTELPPRSINTELDLNSKINWLYTISNSLLGFISNTSPNFSNTLHMLYVTANKYQHLTAYEKLFEGKIETHTYKVLQQIKDIFFAYSLNSHLHLAPVTISNSLNHSIGIKSPSGATPWEFIWRNQIRGLGNIYKSPDNDNSYSLYDQGPRYISGFSVISNGVNVTQPWVDSYLLKFPTETIPRLLSLEMNAESWMTQPLLRFSQLKPTVDASTVPSASTLNSNLTSSDSNLRYLDKLAKETHEALTITKNVLHTIQGQNLSTGNLIPLKSILHSDLLNRIDELTLIYSLKIEETERRGEWRYTINLCKTILSLLQEAKQYIHDQTIYPHYFKQFHFALGRCYMRLRDTLNAKTSFTTVHDILKDPHALLYLSDLYYASRDFVNSYSNLKHFLKVHPDHKWANLRLKWLESLTYITFKEREESSQLKSAYLASVSQEQTLENTQNQSGKQLIDAENRLSGKRSLVWSGRITEISDMSSDHSSESQIGDNWNSSILVLSQFIKKEKKINEDSDNTQLQQEWMRLAIKSRDYMRSIVSECPEWTWVKIFLGIIEWNLGDPAEAQELWSQCTQICPNPYAIANIGHYFAHRFVKLGILDDIHKARIFWNSSLSMYDAYQASFYWIPGFGRGEIDFLVPSRVDGNLNSSGIIETSDHSKTGKKDDKINLKQTIFVDLVLSGTVKNSINDTKRFMAVLIEASLPLIHLSLEITFNKKVEELGIFIQNDTEATENQFTDQFKKQIYEDTKKQLTQLGTAGHAWAWLKLAHSQMRQSEFSNSTLSLQKYLSFNPTHVDGWINLAESYRRQGKLAAAQKSCSMIREISPTSPMVFFLSAFIELMCNNYDESIVYAQKSLENMEKDSANGNSFLMLTVAYILCRSILASTQKACIHRDFENIVKNIELASKYTTLLENSLQQNVQSQNTSVFSVSPYLGWKVLADIKCIQYESRDQLWRSKNENDNSKKREFENTLFEQLIIAEKFYEKSLQYANTDFESKSALQDMSHGLFLQASHLENQLSASSNDFQSSEWLQFWEKILLTCEKNISTIKKSILLIDSNESRAESTKLWRYLAEATSQMLRVCALHPSHPLHSTFFSKGFSSLKADPDFMKKVLPKSITYIPDLRNTFLLYEMSIHFGTKAYTSSEESTKSNLIDTTTSIESKELAKAWASLASWWRTIGSHFETGSSQISPSNVFISKTQWLNLIKYASLQSRSADPTLPLSWALITLCELENSNEHLKNIEPSHPSIFESLLLSAIQSTSITSTETIESKVSKDITLLGGLLFSLEEALLDISSNDYQINGFVDETIILARLGVRILNNHLNYICSENYKLKDLDHLARRILVLLERQKTVLKENQQINTLHQVFLLSTRLHPANIQDVKVTSSKPQEVLKSTFPHHLQISEVDRSENNSILIRSILLLEQAGFYVDAYNMLKGKLCTDSVWKIPENLSGLIPFILRISLVTNSPVPPALAQELRELWPLTFESQSNLNGKLCKLVQSKSAWTFQNHSHSSVLTSVLKSLPSPMHQACITWILSWDIAKNQTFEKTFRQISKFTLEVSKKLSASLLDHKIWDSFDLTLCTDLITIFKIYKLFISVLSTSLEYVRIYQLPSSSSETSKQIFTDIITQISEFNKALTYAYDILLSLISNSKNNSTLLLPMTSLLGEIRITYFWQSFSEFTLCFDQMRSIEKLFSQYQILNSTEALQIEKKFSLENLDSFNKEKQLVDDLIQGVLIRNNSKLILKGVSREKLNLVPPLSSMISYLNSFYTSLQLNQPHVAAGIASNIWLKYGSELIVMHAKWEEEQKTRSSQSAKTWLSKNTKMDEIEEPSTSSADTTTLSSSTPLSVLSTTTPTTNIKRNKLAVFTHSIEHAFECAQKQVMFNPWNAENWAQVANLFVAIKNNKLFSIRKFASQSKNYLQKAKKTGVSMKNQSEIELLDSSTLSLFRTLETLFKQTPSIFIETRSILLLGMSKLIPKQGKIKFDLKENAMTLLKEIDQTKKSTKSETKIQSLIYFELCLKLMLAMSEPLEDPKSIISTFGPLIKISENLSQMWTNSIAENNYSYIGILGSVFIQAAHCLQKVNSIKAAESICQRFVVLVDYLLSSKLQLVASPYLIELKNTAILYHSWILLKQNQHKNAFRLLQNSNILTDTETQISLNNELSPSVSFVISLISYLIYQKAGKKQKLPLCLSIASSAFKPLVEAYEWLETIKEKL